MITRSISKWDDALKLGASLVLLSNDKSAFEKAADSFYFLLNTIPMTHDVSPYVSLLKLMVPWLWLVQLSH